MSVGRASLARASLALLALACTDPSPAPVQPASTPTLLVPPGALAEPLEPAEDALERGETERAAALELTFVGDVVLGRYRGEEGEEDFVEMHALGVNPFAAVMDSLVADVLVGNLESPIMRSVPTRPPIAAKWQFGASAEHLEQLLAGGFDVMSLANNHFFDLGLAGQLEGPQVLAEAGLFAIGTARVEPPLLRVETLEVQGWRIGFVALTTLRNHPGLIGGPHVPFATLRQLQDQAVPLLEAARADHDLLIVVIHWGVEYATRARNANRFTAQALLEAGADLLIGHHPHVLQGLERHRSGEGRDGLIAYSLGNFLFPRSDGSAGMSGVLRVRYLDGGPRPCLDEARLHPVQLVRKPSWHPEPATGQRAKQVRDRMIELSKPHRTRLEVVPGVGDASEELRVAGLRACRPRG